MVGGIPGALAGMIFGGAKGGDLFNAPYIGGVTTVDEFGNLISGEELDKLNAAGGYYTDAARASRRRRDARIANMRQRQALGKRISEANLARLEEQQAREEAARQAEAAAIQDAKQSCRNWRLSIFFCFRYRLYGRRSNCRWSSDNSYNGII